MSSMLTHSGRMVDLLNVKPEDIDIDDITHALSQICRFTGHTRRHYSVAEHSINVAKLLPEPIKIYGLLHDAHEAYIGDISTPLKLTLAQEMEEDIVDNGVEEYMRADFFRRIMARIERPIQGAIYASLGLTEPSQLIRDAVKYADTTMAVVEMKQLFNKQPPAGTWLVDEHLPLPDMIIPMDAAPYPPALEFKLRVAKYLTRDVANKVAPWWG